MSRPICYCCGLPCEPGEFHRIGGRYPLHDRCAEAQTRYAEEMLGDLRRSVEVFGRPR